MKRCTLVIALALWSLSALVGCQSLRSLDLPIRKMQLADYVVDGQKRLFSRVGFWVFEESLRIKLLMAYDQDGALDRPRLHQLLPEALVTERGKFVSLFYKNSAFPEIILADNWLVSLDPKLDAILSEISKNAERRGGQLPIVPIMRVH